MREGASVGEDSRVGKAERFRSMSWEVRRLPPTLGAWMALGSCGTRDRLPSRHAARANSCARTGGLSEHEWHTNRGLREHVVELREYVVPFARKGPVHIHRIVSA